MDNEELTQFIIKELSHHHDRGEIIRKVCEQTTLSWSEAERTMENVAAQNKKKIAARQSPLLIFMSIGTLVIGIGLLAYNMEILVAIFNSDLLHQILGLRSGYYRLASLVTGVGMVIGGLYGSWNVLASFFPDQE
jgi:hypothetical protein